MYEPISSSLGALSDHDWAVLNSGWARGSDWNLEKVGRKWVIRGRVGEGFPLFTTKREAWDTGTNLVCREALHRAWRRMPYHCGLCSFHHNAMPACYQHAVETEHLVWLDVEGGFSFSPMDPDIYTPDPEGGEVP